MSAPEATVAAEPLRVMLPGGWYFEQCNPPYGVIYALRTPKGQGFGINGTGMSVGLPVVQAFAAALEAAAQARSGQEGEVVAPPDLESPEFGRNLFRTVIGESYKPHVWGQHRALHNTSVRFALDMADRSMPEVADVLRAMIWQQVITDNRAKHAFDRADAATDRAAKTEERVKALEGVLGPFAEAGQHIPASHADTRPAAHVNSDYRHPGTVTTIPVSAFRRAAALLADPTTTGAGAGAARREALEEAARWHEAQIKSGHCGEENAEGAARRRANLHHDASAASIRALAAETGGRNNGE